MRSSRTSCSSDCWRRRASAWCSGCPWNCGSASRPSIQASSSRSRLIVGYSSWAWMAKEAVLAELLGQLGDPFVAPVVVPAQADRATALVGLFEQVEDVHHGLDRTGVQVQQAQVQFQRPLPGGEEALDPVDHLAEQFIGVFRVGIALHGQASGLPVALDGGRGLGAGYVQVTHDGVLPKHGSDHGAQAEEGAPVGLFLQRCGQWFAGLAGDVQQAETGSAGAAAVARAA